MGGPSSRVLHLLSLLQISHDWSGQALAERLAVSPRTLRRDIDRLRELGYRVESLRGPTGGYRLAHGSELPPLRFDDEQAVAVAVALGTAATSGADIDEAAARALATIRQVMPSRLRHRIDSIRFAAAPVAVAVAPDVLVAVITATERHEILRFDYDSNDTLTEQRPPRRVEPHAVVARNGRWYLLAWNDDASTSPETSRDGWRTYRVDRISPLAPTRRTFRPRPIPGGDAATFLAGRFKGSAIGDSWPCMGTAIIELPASRIKPFVETDALIEEHAPNATALTLGSWSWHALAARFAAFDAPMQIVRPHQLQAATAALGRRLLLAADEQ